MYMCWSCPLYLLQYAFFPAVLLYTSILHGIQAIVGRTRRGGRFCYNPLFGSHSLGSCAKQHWKDLVRVGRWWRRWCAVHLPPMISFPVLYDGNVIECNGKIQTQAIESWQKKSWRKGASFPSRKKAYSFVFRCLHIHKILGTLIALMNSTYTFLKCWHISLTSMWRKDSL
jgi:hypothetical protein